MKYTICRHREHCSNEVNFSIVVQLDFTKSVFESSEQVYSQKKLTMLYSEQHEA